MPARPHSRRDSVRGTFTKSVRNSVLAALLVTLAACSAAPPKDARPAKSPDQVVLTEGDITDRPYQIIKDVDVTVSKPNVFADDPTQAQVAAELKKRAAEMGADAVIFVRYGALGMGLFNWGEMKGRGRAVVFTTTRP